MTAKNKPKKALSKPMEQGMNRRELIKGFATLPAFGLFLIGYWQKLKLNRIKKHALLSELKFEDKVPTIQTIPAGLKSDNLLRIGIIGYGIRGEQLLRSAGFAHPDWIQDARKKADENPFDKRLDDYLTQDNLHIEITGVCDIFDVHALKAAETSTNEIRPAGIKQIRTAERFRHYQDMLASKDIDAVIIASPDHWHSQMTLDTIQAGKHIYCEKCMTRTESEAIRVHNAVKNSSIVFQLGHQNRQLESHQKAREIIKNDILGPINLIEMTTNRNSPRGAWVYDIHPDGNPQTIDWNQFQKQAPNKVAFSPERFFRWRCWFDYGTGLSGDLLSHEYDALNQILDLGIPHSATASGGIYFYKDGRDVPDTFHVTFEYPKRNLTVIYSATLANSNNRGKVIMGHDATMQINRGLTVKIDPNSTRYKSKIEDGRIDTTIPVFSYQPGSKQIDAVTSATEKYFATRGLMYTYRNGRRVDTTHLHLSEWLNCIRHNIRPSCHIDIGFEEAITCHMATRSYIEGRKVVWDPAAKRIQKT